MRRWENGIAIVILVVGVVAAATFFIRSSSPGGVQPDRAQGSQSSLKQVRLEKGDLRSVITATGSVVAKGQSRLSFDLPGTVVELPAQEGQRIKAGELLAREDDSSQQLALQQADLAMQSAQAALDKLLEPPDARDVSNAEAAVKAAQGNYMSLAGAISPAMVKAANLQYQQAATAAQNAAAMRAEAGGQYATSDPNYQKAVAQEYLSQVNEGIAYLKMQQAQRGPSMLAAIANIAYAQANLARVKSGTNQLDVDDAQAQLAIAKLQRDQAQQQLDKTTLVAPFAGTVTKVNVKLGEVSSGPAILLTDDSALYVDVPVDEGDIGEIQVGQPVQLNLDALQGTTLNGKVQRIDQIANQGGTVTTYNVRIELDKTDAPIKVSMTANATFVLADAPNVLRIPNAYIQQGPNGQTTAALVNADGTTRSVPIKIGVRGTDFSQVISGLNEGDSVALTSNTSASSTK